MLEHEAREYYVESKVGTNSQEFLENVVNKDSCLSSTDNSIFRSYAIGVWLRNVWKPLSMVKPEMWASYNTGSEVLVKNHEKKVWVFRTLDCEMEPQDGNPHYHPAPRSSRHLLIEGYSKWYFQDNSSWAKCSGIFGYNSWSCFWGMPAGCVYLYLPVQSLSLVSSPVMKMCSSHNETKEKESEIAQSCPTLCDPMDRNLPGSSVHGIFQPRVLEWVAISHAKQFGNIHSLVNS